MKVKINFSTIRAKLNIIAAGAAFFFVLLGLFALLFLKKARQGSMLAVPILEIENNIYAMQNAEKEFVLDTKTSDEFYKTGESPHINNFYTYIEQSNKEIQNLLQNSDLQKKENSQLLQTLKNLQLSLKTYKEKFDFLVVLTRERGYKKTGLIGEWTKKGNQIADLIIELNDPALTRRIAQIKSLEMEFLLLHEPQTIQEIHQSIQQYFLQNPSKPNADSLFVQAGSYAKIGEELKKYGVLATQVAEKDQKIGFSSSDGLLKEISLVAKDLETQCSKALELFAQIVAKEVRQAYISLIIMFVVLSIIVVVLIRLLGKSIITPIEKIRTYILELARGKFPEKMKLKARDEITAMLKSLNKFIDSLQAKTHFAKAIGEGNLNEEFQAVSEHDQLGIALLEMQESLKKAEEEDKKRRADDEKRNWATAGVAKFGEILRQNHDKIELLGDNIIRNLVHYLDANQGGLFLYNDEDPDDKHLELIASYAYNRKKFLTKRIEIGEGLVGACVLEQKTNYLTEIPENYISITSGLGESRPQNLLIVPLIFNEKLYGVLEIASFNPFEKYQLDFVENVGEDIASTLSSVRINARTAKLLEQSKRQAEELASQEEEMRQNVEELQATQEEARRREADIAGVVEALNANSLVVEFDMNGKILKINDQFLSLFGMKANDIIGKNHADFNVMSKEPEKYRKFWNDLKAGNSRYEECMIQLPDKQVWLAETYTPILNQEGVPVKVLNVAFNVTKSKQQEKKLKKLKEKLKKYENEN